MTYQTSIENLRHTIEGQGPSWGAIDPEAAARMQIQNRFPTGLDIAKYTAKIMRADMDGYDADPANYTQSLGCWHGFIAQQKMISIKKHFGSTKQRYLYLSGWMIAALRSEFGPLPDQSMHEKTTVPALIEELYTFLKQADARELGMMFRDLDAARTRGDEIEAKRIENATILVANTPMDTDKVKLYGSRVKVSSMDQVAEIEAKLDGYISYDQLLRDIDCSKAAMARL